MARENTRRSKHGRKDKTINKYGFNIRSENMELEMIKTKFAQ